MSDSVAGLGSFSVAGKVALVTGGTGVLGGAMAHGLAAAGVKVAIMGLRAHRAAKVADEIAAAGGVARERADFLELGLDRGASHLLLDDQHRHALGRRNGRHERHHRHRQHRRGDQKLDDRHALLEPGRGVD